VSDTSSLSNSETPDDGGGDVIVDVTIKLAVVVAVDDEANANDNEGLSQVFEFFVLHRRRQCL
jgi:hypothetical protein